VANNQSYARLRARRWLKVAWISLAIGWLGDLTAWVGVAMGHHNLSAWKLVWSTGMLTLVLGGTTAAVGFLAWVLRRAADGR
jgi:hypothetical protein